ncbi:MAG: permease-like cell division protein FtsX [Clostridiales bacterium]
MKIRTIKYIVKEGGVNTYRNMIMSLASAGIVIATLVIAGIFFLILQNLMHSANELSERPQVQVFCDSELDEFQTKEVEKKIKTNSNVLSTEKVSKEDNFKKAKEMFKGDEDLLEGFDVNSFSVSYVLKLKDTSVSSDIAKQLEQIEGVTRVNFSQDLINFYYTLSKWITIITVILLLVLFAFSAFIISNTVKLTIFARRKEINIMKYIGATDWFIRWPFIIEGIIIGLFGGFFAFVIVMWGYQIISNRIEGSGFTNLLAVGDIWRTVILIFIAVGTLVGAGASVFSLNKHLKV